MITVAQKVHIGVDRKIEVNLPPEVPEGDAEVVIVVNTMGGSQIGKGRSEQETLRDFLGCLKDSPNFNEDPVEIQRRLRDEWDHRLPS